MATDSELIRIWNFDVARALWSRVDALKEDLTSDDTQIRVKAETQISQTLTWLLPPITPEQIQNARAAQQQELEEILGARGISRASIRKVARQLAGSKIRGQGRPRTKGSDAIRALQLYLDTGKSWREITFAVDGSCKDRGCSSYCPKCEDVERSSVPARPDKVGRLQARCSTCKFRIRSETQKQRVCFRCSDAIRDLVEKLTIFLDIREVLPSRLLP
jgi:hypothetical protein